MKNRLTALYRPIDTQADKSRAAGIHNNGGGTTSKIFHMRRALPTLEIINDIEESGLISIAEILWFHGLGRENLMERVSAWEKLDAFKMLMTSDVELLRLNGSVREQILDASDAVLCLTEYVLQLMKHFTSKAVLLYDPIDIAAKLLSGMGRLPDDRVVAQIHEMRVRSVLLDNLADLVKSCRFDGVFQLSRVPR